MLFKFFFRIHQKKSTLGEGGLKISGVKNKELVLLELYILMRSISTDESLNAIDTRTSKKILKNILVNYPNLTIILITHSVELAKMMNKVYRLENKKLKLDQ